MTVAAPVSGTCGLHAGVAAAWACQRCGTFVCTDCERRTRPEAAPLCPKCWELRTAVVVEQTATESKRMQIGGLVLGVVAFLNPLVQVASLVLNVRELIKKRGGTRSWMNVVGLGLTGVAMLSWVVLFAWAARH